MDTPYYVSAPYVDASFVASFDFKYYLCPDCGHIEWFSLDAAKKYKEIQLKNDEVDEKISFFKKKLDEIKNFNFKIINQQQNIINEINTYNINDLDITLKQQMEMKFKIKSLTIEKDELQESIRSNNKKIKSLNSKISELEKSKKIFR